MQSFHSVFEEEKRITEKRCRASEVSVPSIVALFLFAGSLVACGPTEQDLEAEREEQRRQAFCAAVDGYSAIEDELDSSELQILSQSDIEDMLYYANEIYTNSPAEDQAELGPIVDVITVAHSEMLESMDGDGGKNFWGDLGSMLAWTGEQVANDHPYGQARDDMAEYVGSQSC